MSAFGRAPCVAHATEVYRRLGKSPRHCRLDKSRRDICRQASICVRSIYTLLTRSRYNEKRTDPMVRPTIMDKRLGTLFHFWGVFQFTQVQPLPSPHKQCWTRVSSIFFRVSTLYRVGGGRTARKFRNSYCVHHNVSNSLLPLTVLSFESCLKLI